VNRIKPLHLGCLYHHALPLESLPTARTCPRADQNLNYYPHVSPVASGGYSGLFTSRRTYGNVMTQGEKDSVTKKKSVSPPSTSADGARLRRRSEPPSFYLPGQELEAGKQIRRSRRDAVHRPTLVLQSGIDFCGGYCVNGLPCKPRTPECLHSRTTVSD